MRLQILQLPAPEGSPEFALVIDGAQALPFVDPKYVEGISNSAKAIGAKGCLIFAEEVELLNG